MLISKYCLDYKQYDYFVENETVRRNVNWLKCTLRDWLNNTFYNIAFDSADKKRMKSINIIYSMDKGDWLTDNVSILSLEEAEKLFDETVKVATGETRYAYQRLTDTYFNGKRRSGDKYDINENISYWLRRLESGDLQAGACDEIGESIALGISPVIAVRPIIVVSLN